MKDEPLYLKKYQEMHGHREVKSGCKSVDIETRHTLHLLHRVKAGEMLPRRLFHKTVLD